MYRLLILILFVVALASAAEVESVSGVVRSVEISTPNVKFAIVDATSGIVVCYLTNSNLHANESVDLKVIKESTTSGGIKICKLALTTPVPATLIEDVKTKIQPLIPSESRNLVSDVGTLQKIDDIGNGVKYALLNNQTVSRYVIEPSDVDLSPFCGKLISLTGYSIGRIGEISTIQMRNVATFG